MGDQGTERALRRRPLALPEAGERPGRVFRLGHCVHQREQRIPLDQRRLADCGCGQCSHQLLRAPRLQLEEALDVAALIVRARRAEQGAADLVRATEPGEGAGQAENLLQMLCLLLFQHRRTQGG